MKQSVNYETGERLSLGMVTNVPSLTRYAQQELGLSLPLGNGRRQGWMKYCKDEMEAQSWDIKDIAVTVDYIKANRKPCRSLPGILWYVDAAGEWDRRRAEHVDDSSLHLKVQKALKVETDDDWARRLSLAGGRALEYVYESWVTERSEIYG